MYTEIKRKEDDNDREVIEYAIRSRRLGKRKKSPLPLPFRKVTLRRRRPRDARALPMLDADSWGSCYILVNWPNGARGITAYCFCFCPRKPNSAILFKGVFTTKRRAPGAFWILIGISIICRLKKREIMSRDIPIEHSCNTIHWVISFAEREHKELPSSSYIQGGHSSTTISAVYLVSVMLFGNRRKLSQISISHVDDVTLFAQLLARCCAADTTRFN